jgi:hypothetical protein
MLIAGAGRDAERIARQITNDRVRQADPKSEHLALAAAS